MPLISRDDSGETVQILAVLRPHHDRHERCDERENPSGSPRLRNVINVPVPFACQVYVVSIGNGPSEVRMTSRWFATSSTISYV